MPIWPVISEKIQTGYQACAFYASELFFYLHVKVYIALAAAANIFLWGFAAYIISVIGEEQIALHYTVDFGIDYYGPCGKIYILPALGILIILLNLALAINMSRRRDVRIISHLLLVSALAVNLLLLMAMASVYLINIR